VLSLDPDASAVLPTTFLPTNDGAWVHIEPFTARVTRLEFDRDAKGAVTTLRLGGDAAPARRGS
jgi:hypothetical protein